MAFQIEHSIYARILADIVDLKLRPDTTLRICELGERYNSSAIPVREALIRLAAEDLVEHCPHVGFRIRRIPLRELLDHYHLLSLLFVDAFDRLDARPYVLSRRLRGEAKNLRLPIAELDCSTSLPKGASAGFEDAIDALGRVVMTPTIYTIYARTLRLTRPLRILVEASPNATTSLHSRWPSFIDDLHNGRMMSARRAVQEHLHCRVADFQAHYDIYG